MLWNVKEYVEVFDLFQKRIKWVDKHKNTLKM